MINILNNIVASRIAAGEIIDRPSSVIRELLDNAIDSGATSIDVEVKEGGISYIRVSDNGCGMDKDDLSICLKSHATSKVKDIDDLYHISSMGFRGEALYALSSCSRLIITSNNGKETNVLTCDNGRNQSINLGAREKGTTVEAIDLFGELPARKQFLKRPSSEFTQIRKVFNEKALAFNQINFSLTHNEKRIATYNSCNKFDRTIEIFSYSKPIISGEFQQIKSQREGFSLYSVSSRPSLFRSEKSYIKIIINNRVVDNYALMQAIIYGYGELLPGGSYPYTALFINIEPSLVDFNIHPTKREVKIRNANEVHHAVSTLFRKGIERIIPKLDTIIAQTEKNQNLFASDFTSSNSYKLKDTKNHIGLYDSKPTNFNIKSIPNPKSNWLDTAKNIANRQDKMDSYYIEEDENETQELDFTYIGQIFKLYLLVERNDKLYIVDQHAAHERILYNKLIERKGVQPLMIPRVFEVDNVCDAFLKKNLDIYKQIGITLERIDDNTYQMLTIMDYYKTLEPKVVEFIQTNTGDVENLLSKFYANVACKKAIKANDIIDPLLAVEILSEVFKLNEPACPHGRTFVVELTKDDLAKLVGRV